MEKERTDQIEFGDFQTPDELAQKVCDLLVSKGIQPRSIVEPTCGKGSYVFASLSHFPTAERVIGVDINAAYVDIVRERAVRVSAPSKIETFQANFFEYDWKTFIQSLPEPILFIGNPPWVTNSSLSSLRSLNLPEKSNFQKHSGLDAKTGKANFDISEWMLIQILEMMRGHSAGMAMLCKTAVARKLVSYAWKNEIPLCSSAIYSIDAKKYFGAAVDACLFICETGSEAGDTICSFYPGLESTVATEWGYRDGFLVADTNKYEKWKHLYGESAYRWRSGIKHDCAKVMELTKVAEGFENGLGETDPLEEDYLFPLLKSSDVANAEELEIKKWMIVPQKSVGDDTSVISAKAPLTWGYLTDHAQYFENRKSSIYQNRASFSIFGVGAYSFAPWKVAISGLYKQLKFRVFGPYQGKPVVFDDTCYFIACKSQAEALFFADLLNSEAAQEFFESFIFWDAKRPVTVDVLKRLSLERLANHLGLEEKMKMFLSAWQVQPEQETGFLMKKSDYQQGNLL